MELTLEETLNWLSAEVNSFSEMNGSLTEEAFFQVFTDEIITAGEIDNADRCYFKKLGMRIDGYGGDPIDSDNELNIIVCDYSTSNEIENVYTCPDGSIPGDCGCLEEGQDPNFCKGCTDPLYIEYDETDNK